MAEARFERERIRLGIRQLHNDQQQVITMRLIDDFSFADIAASLGKSEGAVRVILHRGLVKLKAILDRGQR
jgi:RNA polymerase sigma-70 factor (ECF subfamily)